MAALSTGDERMTLEGLQALLEVIECGSVNQAAARLGVPRSTLARRLDALEGWFGTPLLTTSRDGSAPTTAGARLARGAEDLLRQASALDAAVRLDMEAPRRPVRVAVSPGFHPEQVALGLQHARQRMPEVQLHMRVLADPFLREVDGHPDFIVCFGRPQLGDYRITRLLPLRFSLRASPDYLERHGAPTCVAELGAHALWAWEGAVLATPEGTAIQLQDGARHRIDAAVIVNDVHQLHVIAQIGLGLSLVPTSPFDAFQPGEVEVLEGALGGETGLWVAVPERNVELPWTRAIIDELRGIFAMFSEVDAARTQA
ncbi:MAG: LysR family transcriptional regulator [Alphaproteobacteria bacterium]|nr:LysR family transcriptional regulator [Alphaproteobacteria bacterium]MCB9792412.1 LysR family transcriptional regulator [Alphaproteobacteria bacterium]